MLRTRGLGNSPSLLQRKLEENHGQYWYMKTCHYLADCESIFKSGVISRSTVKDPPPQMPVPKYRWLQTVYACDVSRRIDEVKAAITNTFGTVLKIDSTKKVN